MPRYCLTTAIVLIAPLALPAEEPGPQVLPAPSGEGVVAAGDSESSEAESAPTATLELQNGDRLQGTVSEAVDDSVRWRLETGPTITLPLSSIRLIEDHGRSLTWTPEMGLEMIRPVPAPPPVPSAIEDLNRELDELADPNADEEPTEEQWAALPLLDPQVVFRRTYELTRRIEIGGQFQDGNSESDSLNVAGEFGKRTDRVDQEFKFGGFVATRDHEYVSNRWWLNGTIDFNRADDARWIVFVTSRNEYDEFENLDYRGTLSGGLGYRFVKEEDREWTVRAGPGVTAEFFRDPYRDEYTPDLFGQLEVKQPLWWCLSYESDTTINPSIGDFRIFRLVTQNGLLLPLDEEQRWNLKVGFRMEYNSQPNPGRKYADYTTTLLLVYKRGKG